jgi:hypothetical protein
MRWCAAVHAPSTCRPSLQLGWKNSWNPSIRNRHWQSPGRYHKKLPNSPARHSPGWFSRSVPLQGTRAYPPPLAKPVGGGDARLETARPQWTNAVTAAHTPPAWARPRRRTTDSGAAAAPPCLTLISRFQGCVPAGGKLPRGEIAGSAGKRIGIGALPCRAGSDSALAVPCRQRLSTCRHCRRQCEPSFRNASGGLPHWLTGIKGCDRGGVYPTRVVTHGWSPGCNPCWLTGWRVGNQPIMSRDCSNVALYTLLLGYMARSLAHSSTGMWDALSSSLRLRRGVERV